ncbi:MAG: hypothetical protein RSA79_00720 [Oscillospiraceae bacterium]
MSFKKKNKEPQEPAYFMSATNIQTINYKVYYMSLKEKILYFLVAFVVGAAVGYLFYGGIGKDEFGQATTVTYVLNILIPLIAGLIAGKLFLPIRVQQIIDKRKDKLSSQFKDMLDALTTSLGAGKNVTDSFYAIRDDLAVQYEEDAYIIKELQIMIFGIQNNIAIEDMLYDFGLRSANDDIKSFANVFKIGYRKGGNIKDIIRNTHSILNDKMDISEDIKTIVTGSKTEQNLMVMMPIGLIAVIKMMSADFAANFVTPIGIVSTTIAIITFVIAYYVGKQVLDIKI